VSSGLDLIFNELIRGFPFDLSRFRPRLWSLIHLLIDFCAFVYYVLFQICILVLGARSIYRNILGTHGQPISMHRRLCNFGFVSRFMARLGIS